MPYSSAPRRNVRYSPLPATAAPFDVQGTLRSAASAPSSRTSSSAFSFSFAFTHTCIKNACVLCRLAKPFCDANASFHDASGAGSARRTNHALHSAAVTGVKANWLKGSLRAVGIDPDKANLDAPNFGDPTVAFKRWKDTWSAGQSVDLVQRIEPASDIVARFVREYEAAQ